MSISNSTNTSPLLQGSQPQDRPNQAPNEDPLIANMAVIQAEFEWLKKVLQLRISTYTKETSQYSTLRDIPNPNLSKYPSTYADFVKEKGLTPADRLVLLLALVPMLKPGMLDVLEVINSQTGRVHVQVGGVIGSNHRGLLPTIETALFLIGGENLLERSRVLNRFEEQSTLIKQKVITLSDPLPNDPATAAIIKLGEETWPRITSGIPFQPKFSSTFPAQLMTTRLEWEDLVLEFESEEKIKEILNWIKYEERLMEEWGLKNVLKKGYRSLFYGPPGTGKTLTAALLGKVTQRDVYRVDISRVVSKFIGETEKNLARVFDLAENKEWILFFDEADALFGKRTLTSDAKDRYANQEVAYLLQRIEDFPGVVLLSTNLKSNLDPAFMRRFQTLIHFPTPDPAQRLTLWENCFRDVPVHEDVDFRMLAKKYQVTGGMIINILRSCCLFAIDQEDQTIYEDLIIEEIRAEMRKIGKSVK